MAGATASTIGEAPARQFKTEKGERKLVNPQPNHHSANFGLIDSQSGRTTESGGISGYDAGKKVKGRERHILTDTPGLLLVILVLGANVQDRDSKPSVLKSDRLRIL